MAVGQLASGDHRFTVTSNSMPLNNDGDEIELINADGEVVDRFLDGPNDVSPGTPVNRWPLTRNSPALSP